MSMWLILNQMYTSKMLVEGSVEKKHIPNIKCREIVLTCKSITSTVKSLSRSWVFECSLFFVVINNYPHPDVKVELFVFVHVPPPNFFKHFKLYWSLNIFSTSAHPIVCRGRVSLCCRWAMPRMCPKDILKSKYFTLISTSAEAFLEKMNDVKMKCDQVLFFFYK